MGSKINLIESIPDFWDFWNNNGIDTAKEISILFTFYSAVDKASSNFIQDLEKKGYKTEKKSKRTLLIFKGYEITAEKTKVWTMDELKNALIEIEASANQNSTILEGYFAADPN